MKIALYPLESATEPRRVLFHEQMLAMVLQPGSIEVGLRPSEMMKYTYEAGGMILSRRQVEEWVRLTDVHLLTLSISAAAITAACDGAWRDVELRSTPHLVDARVRDLVSAVNAERIEEFPSGRLFMESVEQALAAVLVSRYAVKCGSVQTHRGGLPPARLRRVLELVHAKIGDELTLPEMAAAAELSTAHFSQVFRKSTGESPHQFVVRRRVERAKKMLRTPGARVLDVALACGFKTQQHFARVFRYLCGASPTEYRREFL
jgi:AraC family transcriptional regulator